MLKMQMIIKADNKLIDNRIWHLCYDFLNNLCILDKNAFEFKTSEASKLSDGPPHEMETPDDQLTAANNAVTQVQTCWRW